MKLTNAVIFESYFIERKKYLMLYYCYYYIASIAAMMKRSHWWLQKISSKMALIVDLSPSQKRMYLATIEKL